MAMCCTGCFDEALIEHFIRDNRRRKPCEFCGRQRRFAADTEAVGNFIREGLSRAYEQVDGYSSWAPPGESVQDVLFHGYPIFSERVFAEGTERVLLKTLMEDSGPDWHGIADGEVDPFGDVDADCIALRDRDWGEGYNRFAWSWASFKFHVSHGLRFFEPKSEASLRQTLAAPLLELLEGLESGLETNQRLYRVIPVPAHSLAAPMEPKEALAAAGPAPREKAREGRMNPAGISYMYLAGDVETCLAEKRLGAGEFVLVGEFMVRRNLRILDLAVLPSIGVRSMFDPDYDHDLVWAKGFANAFRDEISRPVGEESEPASYVPTQVLSEYFRMEGFDGISYPSSQYPGGMNYALFCGPRLPDEDSWAQYCPPVFSEWLRLERLSRLQVLGLTPSHATKDTVGFGPDDFRDEVCDFREEDMDHRLELLED